MMKNKNLLNLVRRKSYEQTRRERFGLKSVVSRFSLVSLICLCMLTVGVGNAWGATATFTASDQGWSGTSTKTQTVSGVTFSFAGGTTNPTYYAADGLRTYENCVITISSTNTITGIVFTYTISNSGYLKSFNTGTWTSGTKTWSGSATSINCTVGHSSGSKNGQVRITSIVVTYTPSAASHTLSFAVSPAASGSVELSATSVTEGSTATATATPATHYVFDRWSISGTGSTLSSTTTNPTTVTMGTANTTVTANFVAAPKASITLSEAGATTTDASTYYVGDSYTLPSSTGASCGTKVLVGWSTVEVAETNTKPTSNFYEKGASVTLAATQTFYAVFATASGGGGAEWVETTIGDLTGSDIFVLATPAGYAVSNNNGTSSAPTAISITVSAGKITSSVTDAMKWNLGGNSTDGYIFYPNGTTTTWLYCSTTASSGSNNNIRVGTGDRNHWIADGDGDYVTNDTYTDRWLCNYNNADFRGYIGSSVTSDIVSKFYKYSAGTTYSAYSTTCAVTHTVSQAVSPAGKATVTLGATTVAEGATTTASCGSFTAGYELDNWSISGTGATLSSTTANPTTITMGTANVTVTANLRCITPTFSAHPSNATYNQNASPTALSVTAAAGGASLSYQWMQCATSGGTYVNVTGGSGGTTRTYTPPTTSLGTMYYKCKVTNAASGCSANATSNAASVTVKGTVTYDANGGTGTMTDASSPYTSGATVTVKSNTFTAPEGKQFDHWNTAANNSGATYAAGVTFSMSGNTTLYAQWACITPSISVQPSGATYTKDDTPTDLSVTASGGTLSYQWKQCATIDGVYSNVASGGTSSTYSPSTASVGTTYYKCVVTNTGSSCNTTVTSDAAAIVVNQPSYFPNGKTIFIQAESTSAWTGDGCVKAWFHTAGGSETAQSTYWLFDATDGDAGKKLFATVVPASGNLPYLDIQRFAANCSDWWNKNGGCSYSDANGSNTVRSTGKHDDSSDGDYVRWNASGVTLDLHGDPSGDDWASSLASFSDQGSGEWTATYNNYAPANAAGESQDFKVKTNYNGWIGNTGTNSNATLSGMHVGSTYNITATLNVISHSLTMSKTFVKGEVSFDLQGHGSAISKLTNVTAGSKISAPSPAPTATGYTFGGWFTDPECTDEWNFATDEVDETMTLYAKWTTNVYTITKTLTNVANAGLPASFTYTGATTTALNSTFTVDATNFFLPSSIAVTMGGTPLTVGTDYTYNNSTGAFTFSAVITGNIVITATATAKLKSIAITTQPTTRKYFAGESFSSTGAVVTATMGDGSTKAVTASTTWTPSGALSAGSQTITASYTENGINQTTTTTVDVYSVTVSKVNEDGDAVSADGVTATWTVGTKALAASASDASKYVFKQWDVTGATAASTSSANTTLSNPTANVVVNAVFYKPRVVKWSVNGNDSYATGGPTTTVAYNGTISTVPTNPSGLACAGTFIAWTDAAHNNGTTAKPNASYYGAALYSAAGDFPNITAATTTFYAVFAEKTNSDGYKYIGDDGTLTDGKKYIFVNAKSAGSAYALKATDLAAPNSGNNGTAVSVTVTSNAEGVLVTTINTALEFEYVSSGTKLKYEVDGPATRYLFINGDGVGMKSDDSRSRYTTDAGLQGWNNKVTTYYDVYYNSTSGKFEKMASAGSRVYAFIKQTATYGNYVTECDANIVSVTYDANGGATNCTNTTTDKTEDFTVCSSAPTRDYYTFAGWLCSADSKTYAASATIPAAAIDADFTLTAQWTPVPYSITYELYGGTNSGSNPATYNVTTATITLQDPTKGHDRFEGWYSTYSAGVYSDQVTSIPLGSHGAITLHAKWTARHEIIFDADGATTTIYRADDEDLSASVAGQGSVPSDPSAPTACSSKVFVGWSESTIDGETDDEPGDLMKPAAGTVNANKHYYAVWATRASSLGPVTVFNDAFARVDNGTAYGNKGKISSTYVYGTGTAGEARISSSSNVGYLDIDLSDKTLESSFTITFKLKYWSDSESGTLMLGCEDEGSTASFSPSSVTYPTTSGWQDYSSTVTNVNAATQSVHLQSYSAKRVYIKDIVITQTSTIYTYSAYSTSCCATKVTLSQNSPEHGTIAFGKATVPTCDEDKEVSLTITPAEGYQLHSYEVATGSGKVATKSVSPAISLDNNSSAVQNITLTFASGANGAYDVTASFTEMTVTSWTWTMHDGGGAIPDPLNLYIGQSARLDVVYTPSTVISGKKTYERAKNDTYLNWVGGKQSGYTTISGKASTGENTTPVTFTHADGPTKTVNVKVLPLPLTHFVDLVHGKAFANVAATIEDNALSATKTTPTSDDWTTPNANDCEENHLHLVGWIREDWPALVAYLNGTGAAPTTVAITGAGNDGAGHAYYIAAGASINVQTFDGVTFYAVWSKVE